MFLLCIPSPHTTSISSRTCYVFPVMYLFYCDIFFRQRPESGSESGEEEEEAAQEIQEPQEPSDK